VETINGSYINDEHMAAGSERKEVRLTVIDSG